MLSGSDESKADGESSGTCGESITWTMDADGNLVFSGTGFLEIRPDISSYKVKTVVIEEGITSIGSNYFSNYYELKSVLIPSSVTTIGYNAFQKCTALETVTLNEGLTEIGSNSFQACFSLKSIVLPNSLNVIQSEAFSECTSLESITIPANVISIGQSAFSKCTSLTAITVDPDNEGYSSENDIIFNKNHTILVYYPAGKSETSFTIPASVVTVETHAFEYNEKLESVTFHDGFYRIERYAFMGCSKISTFELPASLTFVDSTSFIGCSSLSLISVDSENTGYFTQDGVLFDKNSTQILSYPANKTSTEYTVPETVSRILDYAFSGNTHLESLTLPNEIRYIGYCAFKDCTALRTVGSFTVTHNLPPGYSIIVQDPLYQNAMTFNAFEGCTSLESLIIPEFIMELKTGAFNDCTALSTITIPKTIETIHDGVFIGCTSLNSVNVAQESEYFCAVDGVLFDKDLTKLILYPAMKIGYRYEIPEGVQSISGGAFYHCPLLVSVTLPSTITSIQTGSAYIYIDTGTGMQSYPISNAFVDCCQIYEVINLSSLNIAKGSYSYGSIARYAGLVTTNNLSVIHTTDNGFVYANIQEKSYLLSTVEPVTDLVLPVKIDGKDYTLSNNSFNNRDDIQSVTVPRSFTKYPSNAFKGCNNLTTIYNESFVKLRYTDPATVIGNVEEVTLESGCRVLYNDYSQLCRLIKYSSSGTEAIIDQFMIGEKAYTVVEISRAAFDGCNTITSITLSKNVEMIDEGTIGDCALLKNIFVDSQNPKYRDIDGVLFDKAGIHLLCYPKASTRTTYVVPASAQSLDLHAFWGCVNLQTIDIGNNVSAIELASFYGSKNLTAINVGANNPYYSSVDGVLYNSDISAIVIYPEGKDTTSFSVPESVISISDYAFIGCSNLIDVQLPSDVFYLGEYTFYHCTSLKTIILPIGITTMPISIFEGCTALESVSIPESVTSIGMNAFNGCSSLTEIALPSNLTSIRSGAFSGCESLKTILIPENVLSIGDGAFRDCSEVESIILPSGLQEIPVSLFDNCISLKEIVLPAGVRSLNESAFNNCQALESISVAETNELLSTVDGVLYNKDMTQLIRYPAGKMESTFTIGQSIETISYNALFGCTHLKAIYVDERNEHYLSIDGLLYTSDKKQVVAVPTGCESTMIRLPEGLEEIDLSLFEGSNVKTLYLPDSFLGNKTSFNGYGPITLDDNNSGSYPGTIVIDLTSASPISPIDIITVPIDSSVVVPIYYVEWFNGTGSIAELIVSENHPKFTSINGVLYSKDQKTLIVYPSGKTDTSFTIPSHVEIVDTYAFNKCTNLRSLTIPGNVTSASYSSIVNCPNINQISFGNGCIAEVFVTNLPDFYDESGQIKLESTELQGKTFILIDGKMIQVVTTMTTNQDSFEKSSDEDAVAFTSSDILLMKTTAENDPTKTASISLTDGIIVSFDNAALRSIGTGASTLSVNPLAAESLSESIKDIVGDRPVFEISFGNNTNFGNGSVTFKLPYALKEGEDPNNLLVYYINEGKVSEKIPCTYSEGFITFSTNHLSTYSIGYEVPAPEEIPLMIVIIAVIVGAVVGFAAVFMLRKRHA